MSVSLKHINKTYPNGYQAVKDFNLDIKDEEFIIFVGPSGCGKSTTLRMVAGLEDITGSELLIDGKRMNEAEPKDRNIAMVFQNYALYPHMTVRKNMEYPLKIAKLPKEEIKARVEEASRILGLDALLDRKPNALSGGQRQRVAMGRAIVRNPKVLLMDEPLSNLDAKLRGQMRIEITKLHKKLKSTIIYVTHDQTEAMTLGDRIVVMCDGDVQQIDTPENLYNRPANKFVAGFIGAPQMNFIDMIVEETPHGTLLKQSSSTLTLTQKQCELLKEKGFKTGDHVTLGIRPENLSAAVDSKDSSNCIEGVVEVFEMLGSSSNIYVSVNGQNIAAIMPAGHFCKEGDKVSLNVDIDAIHLFDPKSELNLLNM